MHYLGAGGLVAYARMAATIIASGVFQKSREAM